MAEDMNPGTALRQKAERVISRLKGLPDERTVKEGRDLVKALQNAREFPAAAKVAEAVVRQAPKDAETRRRYAQALIEMGHAVAALDMLRQLIKDRGESTEAYGLIGRANKQIFFDAGDKTSDAAREALKNAVAAYRVPFKASPKAHWHGVNLIAVLTAARRIGLRVARDLEPAALATRLLEALDRMPEAERDIWYHASLAEANVALGNWEEVEKHLRLYAGSDDIHAFALGSTLRQLTEVWGIGADERGRQVLDILQARLMSLPGSTLELEPAEVRRLTSTSPPSKGRLEAVLGSVGPKTYRWMQNGMMRARSVGAICRKSNGRRHGTCFLVQAQELGLPDNELVALTNHHVVNREGSDDGISPAAAMVKFEALDNPPEIDVTEVVWSSPWDALDASILRLKTPPQDIAPLTPGRNLPVRDEEQRVYIIGYPGGQDLAFSFQDNELLDHEGEPGGVPTLPGRVRLHYRAPTEGGSSGSPVFNEDLEVIALHHYGGKQGVPKLNGKQGTYGANEGVWICSIQKASK